MVIALGTIIEWHGEPLTEWDVHNPVLDWYDHWNCIDDRIKDPGGHLRRSAAIFGHDLVNMASYSHEVLRWLAPDQIRHSQSVVSVGAMAEAFLVSVRSAYDAVAIALASRASTNRQQVPQDGLGSLLRWAGKNPERVHTAVLDVLSSDLTCFWRLRQIRDQIVHRGADAIIHCTGRQFNLWLHSPTDGWISREPLLPLLASQFEHLLGFAGLSGNAINPIIDLPTDRVRSRVVQGVLIPALHNLRDIAHQYAEPSP